MPKAPWSLLLPVSKPAAFCLVCTETSLQDMAWFGGELVQVWQGTGLSFCRCAQGNRRWCPGAFIEVHVSAGWSRVSHAERGCNSPSGPTLHRKAQAYHKTSVFLFEVWRRWRSPFPVPGSVGWSQWTWARLLSHHCQQALWRNYLSILPGKRPWSPL